MLVGEAPGRMEDQAGRPFVGPAGHFLDGILAKVGISRERLFITSSVKCRPPGNRVPRADELETCRAAYLLRQIEWINPRVIVAMGATAIWTLLGVEGRMADLHGRMWLLDGRRVIATFHPAWSMRFDRSGKRMAADMRKVLVELPGLASCRNQ
jgi:uracil-DNA glycosylase